jgi:hypothetical protein
MWRAAPGSLRLAMSKLFAAIAKCPGVIFGAPGREFSPSKAVLLDFNNLPPPLQPKSGRVGGSSWGRAGSLPERLA